MADAIVADLNSSGIYQIRNLVNGKRYVGSAVKIGKRWAEHRRHLHRGEHHSVALQRAWAKYGPESFAFSIICVCLADELIRLEQAEIDAGCDYNICTTAGSSLGVKPSPEARAKMSARLRGNQRTKGMKYSREICERMAAPKRGRKRPPRSAEWCLRLSESKKGNKSSVGRVLSVETRQRIASALVGRKQTVERRMQNPLQTLSPDSVRAIRAMRANGDTYAEIADRIGAKSQLVGKICRGQRYDWVA